MKNKERKPLVAAVVVALMGQMLPGCAVDPATGKLKYTGIPAGDPCNNSSAVVGGLIGAGVGVGLAVLANKIDHGKLGAPAQAAIIVGGAAVGVAVGHELDHRRCEYAQLEKKYHLDIQVASITAPSPNRVTVSPPAPATAAYASAHQQEQQNSSQPAVPSVGLSVSIRDDGEQFASGSDQLTPKAREYFWEIAKQYSVRNRTASLNENSNATAEDRQAVDSLRNKRVLLIGHTDDTGDSRFNADLSERRALAVARTFAEQGIPEAQIYYQGAGETLPIADNRTEEGRAKNRRVEIVDLTDGQVFKQYLASRAPDIRYFRPAPSATTASAIPSDTPSPTATVSAKKAALSPPVARSVPLQNAGSSPYVAFDFGGTPSGSQGVAAQFGRPLQEHTFSIFSTAYASESSLVSACNADRPRIANGVKSLRDEKTISITEYLPGLYGTSWQDTLNGNLVGVRNVAVFRDGGSPARQPDVLIYRDYRPGSKVKPDFITTSEVNTYRGDRALLYRVFVKGPIQCMDIVFPYDNSGAAYESNFYYERAGRLLVVPFKPRVSKY